VFMRISSPGPGAARDIPHPLNGEDGFSALS
jgi:hypothetical protein